MCDQKTAPEMTLRLTKRFKRPIDVVEANVGIAEKLAILEEWEVDDRALQRAEDEGMGGGEHPHLHKVQLALSQLRTSTH